MTDRVKQFIESYVDIIELNDWEQLFTLWYIQASSLTQDTDDNLLKELFEVLYIAGIDAYNASKNARKQIISDQIISYIDNEFYLDAELEAISFSKVVNNLESRLSLTLSEIREIFEKTIAQSNYRRDYGSLTVWRS